MSIWIERRECDAGREQRDGKDASGHGVGIEACRAGQKVRFCRVTELITQLMEAREETELGRDVRDSWPSWTC